MQLTELIRNYSAKGINAIFNYQIAPDQLTISETKPEFKGDYTLVLFPFIKLFRQSPDAIGTAIGDWMKLNTNNLVTGYEIVKGFLNVEINHDFWIDFLKNSDYPDFGFSVPNHQKVMVEYSSPNTNKPLHLGHLRNNFLGFSIAEIFKANGFEVMKTCVVNDRGIHICKSMLAWQKFGNGETPASSGKKGDHLVGEYYVQFEMTLKEQTIPIFNSLLEGNVSVISGVEQREKAEQLVQKMREPGSGEEKIAEIKAALNELARNSTPIMAEVRDMLLKWEEGDEEILSLWKKMNGWVYEGFDVTYSQIGSSFDKIYYESDTYLIGKDYVEEGLSLGVFYKKEDGSTWIDLTNDGLDEKLVLRKDGTSVYITQDIGLAKHKYRDFPMDQSIYVIGDEQNYHMKVLELICKKLNMPFADGIHHLSYGMVDLPSGRMKSREGTVVDADDLCAEMENIAAQKTAELGKVEGFSENELAVLYHTIGMGALKFFLLRVDPKKRMVFNPEESIDFHGFTGPFIQYSYARIQSVIRKAGEVDASKNGSFSELLPLEKDMVRLLEQFPTVVKQAGKEMSPSVIANYSFEVAKKFNSFYAVHSISKAENEEKKNLRLAISKLTGMVLRNGMKLLGIDVPERM